MADMLAPAPVETLEADGRRGRLRGLGDPRRGGTPGRPRLARYLGVLPFLAFVAVFLLWPTYIVVAGAFQTSTSQRGPRR